jgi:hypothetical protein
MAASSFAGAGSSGGTLPAGDHRGRMRRFVHSPNSNVAPHRSPDEGRKSPNVGQSRGVGAADTAVARRYCAATGAGRGTTMAEPPEGSTTRLRLDPALHRGASVGEPT